MGKMDKLKAINIKGYKSFRDAQVQFGDVTVFLGANGAGKSNLVSFFKMLSSLSTGALQRYIGQSGGPDSLLYYGRKTTDRIEAEVVFGKDTTETRYAIELTHAAPDTLMFADERVTFERKGPGKSKPQEVPLVSGHKESLLLEHGEDGNKTCKVLHGILSRCRAYQFHDTSLTAKIRTGAYIEDTEYLRHDAGNLAPFLHALRKHRPEYYRGIVGTIRLVFPSFDDFSLEPSVLNKNSILLNWTARDHPDYLFGPHQLSDGTLRFMALATLFLQPIEKRPSVIVLDEPELGLHPHALAVFAGLVKSAALDRQVVFATQSTRLVDEFEPSQIAVLELDKEKGTRCNVFKPEDLAEWLKDYSLSELWEMNHLGGRP